MAQSKFIIVSEDPVLIEKAKGFAANCGMECEVRNPHSNSGFYPSLASGSNPLTAIHAYRGNLTEAAKALGIGRATLYRKVKLYNIDPASARRKKAA